MSQIPSLSRSGLAFVICAPSGTGKSTLVRRLTDEFPKFAYSVSYTTRAPRKGEQHTVDYHFTTVDEFAQLRDANFFAEWAEVHGNYYGTPLQEIKDLLAEGRDIIFDIDVQGAIQLKTTLPAAHFVFLLPPSRQELEKRLRARETETEETLARRLRNAREEILQANWFNALVVNDNLEVAYKELREIYLAATASPSCHGALLQTLLRGWGV